MFLPGTAPTETFETVSFPWRSLATDLEQFFKGEVIIFKYPLDLTGYSGFGLKVIEVVSGIPYGQTFSYRDVAVMAGSPLACRAVGRVMASNRHPLLIPCHRVIKTDGTEGGYSAGKAWKRMLLALESGENPKPLRFKTGVINRCAI